MRKTVAILTGGQARRLGGLDKSRLDVAGITVLDRQFAVLNGLADEILLVGGQPQGTWAPRARLVPDRFPGQGSLGGIATALWGSDEPVLVLACDMPFVTAGFLAALFERASGVDVVLPRTRDGYHPLCAVYAPACLPAIEAQIRQGALKVTDAIKGLRVREVGPDEIVQLDPSGRVLLNINTPEELAQAVSLADSSRA